MISIGTLLYGIFVEKNYSKCKKHTPMFIPSSITLVSTAVLISHFDIVRSSETSGWKIVKGIIAVFDCYKYGYISFENKNMLQLDSAIFVKM